MYSILVILLSFHFLYGASRTLPQHDSYQKYEALKSLIDHIAVVGYVHVDELDDNHYWTEKLRIFPTDSFSMELTWYENEAFHHRLPGQYLPLFQSCSASQIVSFMSVFGKTNKDEPLLMFTVPLSEEYAWYGQYSSTASNNDKWYRVLNAMEFFLMNSTTILALDYADHLKIHYLSKEHPSFFSRDSLVFAKFK